MSVERKNETVSEGADIEEDEIFAPRDNLDDSEATGGSRTPANSSQRSSQRSLPASDGPDASDCGVINASASTVAKTPKSTRGIGARQLVEKRRKSAAPSSSTRETTNGRSAGSGEKRPIFTLNHVKRFFGSQDVEPHQQPSQRQQRRASNGTVEGDDMVLRQRLSRLSIDSLPAIFLAKHLGEAPATSLFGVECIRKPVDALLKAASKRKSQNGGLPLPIAQLTVVPQGISVRPHPQSEGVPVAKAFHAIESISYCTVDPEFQRIFCLVTATSTQPADGGATASGGGTPTCHSFLCNSADTAHRLVLAITFAFEISVADGSGGTSNAV